MNRSPTDLYLAELRLLMPPGRARARFLREVRDHIADAAEERVEHGAPPLEAETDAIAGMGDPGLVAERAAPELRRDDGLIATVRRLLRPTLHMSVAPA